VTLSGLSAVVLASIVAGAIGVAVAWWLRRYTTLSIRNAYLAAVVLSMLAVAAVAVAVWVVAAVLAPLATFAVSASLMGRQWRLSDLGAGEELRRYEQQRRWIWQALRLAAPESASGSPRRARSSASGPGPRTSRTSR
jgi:hypothetical protein